MSIYQDLFLKIYKQLNQSIYHQETLDHMIYGRDALQDKIMIDQKYNISYELLTIYQAGAIAFQTMLNIEGQKKEDIIPLSQILLHEAFRFQPEKSYSAPREHLNHFDKIICSNLSFPNLSLAQDKLWQIILKNIAQTPLASIWVLFIPFLEKAFLKGLCPFSFYYHITLSPNPNRVIDIAHYILEHETEFQKNKPCPMTYAIFKNIKLENEEISDIKIDSLTEIIKSYCEKE